MNEGVHEVVHDEVHAAWPRNSQLKSLDQQSEACKLVQLQELARLQCNTARLHATTSPLRTAPVRFMPPATTASWQVASAVHIEISVAADTARMPSTSHATSHCWSSTVFNINRTTDFHRIQIMTA